MMSVPLCLNTMPGKIESVPSPRLRPKCWQPAREDLPIFCCRILVVLKSRARSTTHYLNLRTWTKMELRDYQIELAKQSFEKLSRLGIVYLALEMRVGKTLIALLTAFFAGAKSVLFVTKKKAMSSIESDYQAFDFGFKLHVCNYEQVDKAGSDFDLVIIDEAHSLGAFPKPAIRTQNIKTIVGAKNLILLSGTPSPESYSQLYHQFWISDRSPFSEYSNFYKWAHQFVDIKQKLINGLRINDYKKADKVKIWEKLSDYFIVYTQAQAGFEQVVTEEVISVPMLPETMSIVDSLIKDKIVTLPSGEVVVADTAVKLQSKVHQICSGTVITEDSGVRIFDYSKALHIVHHYAGKKKAIFYKYTAEAELLKKMFEWTESPDEFNNSTGLTFISQVRSGSMGVNLSTADIILFYNIDFSAVIYWQARARMQSKDRVKESVVLWLFSAGGIEEKIYDAVIKKKDYTTKYFERDYGKAHSKKDRGLAQDKGSVRCQGVDREPVRSAGFTRVL
jgi:hypothetical protein